MTENTINRQAWRLCVAPMMDWTDRHERYFLRLLSRHVRLYTEMVTTGAILHGDRAHLLGFDPAEHPVALQLGGSEPEELARCAAIGEEYGYDEINLNVGCPSDRVQSGRFGACLMAEPERVARCIAAMRDAVSVPVTVKCRIGIDEMPEPEGLLRFVDTVMEQGGCPVFIVHARKAWLEGLSPRQNRDVPPLRYEQVYALKQRYPELIVVINGGVGNLEEAERHLREVDGVMLGRAAYQRPWLLGQADARLFDSMNPLTSPHAAVRRLLPYVDRELASGTRLAAITRHLLGLFQGVPGARRFRRHLSENAHRPGAGREVLEDALALVPETDITEQQERIAAAGY